MTYHEALNGINKNNNLQQSARHRCILQENEREEKEEEFLMEHKIMKQNIFTRHFDQNRRVYIHMVDEPYDAYLPRMEQSWNIVW